MNDLQIEIRPAHTWADFLQCEELQRQVWQLLDDREVVPAHLLITAHKNGGLLLGAFDKAKMIGFVFGFLGAEGTDVARRLKHCSHMLAVLPRYRAQGVGAELKKRQREYLLAQGLELATWTYDPLQAVNATLNLARLGALARRYIRDAYGEMLDGLNAGVASDRFEVEWWLSDARVREYLAGNRTSTAQLDAPVVYRIAFDENDLPYVEAEMAYESHICRVEIPADFAALKARDLPLARKWREWTRATFESAFRQGYAAIDAINWTDGAKKRHFAYILQKLI